MKIWRRFLCQRPQSAILDALMRVNISTEACESVPQNGSLGPGIIFFDEINAELTDLLRKASRGGMERVLAIALTRADLKAASVWSLLKIGASDVFAWDHSADPSREVAARFERWEKVDEIVRSPLVRDNLAGQSRAWIHTVRQVVEVARFTDASVLITGESGTGKELIARLIHTLDPRPGKRDLVVCDCATIVPELSGSEFFGHERGAFTGAVAARDGAFAQANGGTLFLDEVGELPLNLQAELLRVVQERTYKRVGGNAWQKSDFRLVCATNRNLVDEHTRDRFRGDLYYRIASWTCCLPPLRARREDILVLAKHFIEQQRPDDPPELDNAVREFLIARQYPGNIRELRQLLTRIIQHHVGPGPITAGDIPEEERPPGDEEFGDWRDEGLERAVRLAVAAGVNLKEIERATGELAERIVLEEEDGNIQQAASRLGMTNRALHFRRAARRQNGNGAPATI
jgi:transcriptional regulator with GAF, ATPase, and Fis domain